VTRPTVEVADILRARGNDFIDCHQLRIQQLKVIRAITRCRTAALGGHIDTCPRCGSDQTISYNSCIMGSISLWGVRRLNDARSKGRTRVQLTIKSALSCYVDLKLKTFAILMVG
jgi:transposase-like zinc-binding protein